MRRGRRIFEQGGVGEVEGEEEGREVAAAGCGRALGDGPCVGGTGAVERAAQAEVARLGGRCIESAAHLIPVTRR
jgi:hypothetical protein